MAGKKSSWELKAPLMSLRQFRQVWLEIKRTKVMTEVTWVANVEREKTMYDHS